MSVAIQCPKCNTQYKLNQEPDESRKIRCSKCGHTFNTTIAPTLPTPVPAKTQVEETGGDTVKVSKPNVKKSLIGQEIGGCQIEKLLGQGGMGAVYRAHHKALDIPVALKVLPSHFAKKDSTFVDRFIREARSAAKLKHQNIVGVLNVGQDKGVHYIIMDFVDGTSVEQLLRKEGVLPVDQACEMIDQVCDALELARKNNIVHRDIKPDNIMIDSDGTVKLADLGLAKSVDEDTSVTMSGVAMGTPHYMAPEQAEDARSADHRADLYSLGCTFYRMLCDTVPYEGTSVYAVLRQHEHEPVPDPRANRHDVNEGVAAIIMKMMAKDPNDRYQTAGEIRDDLSRVRQGLEPLGAVAPAVVAMNTKRPSVRKKRRRKKKKLWMIGAAAAGMLVLLLLLFSGGDDKPGSVATKPKPTKKAGSTTSAKPKKKSTSKKKTKKKSKPTVIAKTPEPARDPVPQPTKTAATPKPPAPAPIETAEDKKLEEEMDRIEDALDSIWHQDMGDVAGFRVERRTRTLASYRVYRAFDQEADEEVTMVVGKADYAQSEAGQIFLSTAELLVDIEHEALPQVYELFEGNRYFALATRILPFQTHSISVYLRNVPDEDRLKTMGELLKQALEAMVYYHNQKLVHRAISPNRLRVDEEGRLYLWDFMHAIRQDEDRPPSKTVRSSRYTAPEVRQGDGATIRSDLYSLGKVFRELIDENNDEWEGHSRLNAIQHFLEKMTHHDPQHRFTGPNQALETIRILEKLKDEIRKKSDRFRPRSRQDFPPPGRPPQRNWR
ncbi:MAG: protein kinase domain-containing protein [Planctomycetota bacterium]|jgi:predicted Zn finger-like uncharacterized protein